MEGPAIFTTVPIEHTFIPFIQPEESVQPLVVEPEQPSAFHADLLAHTRRERPVRERNQGFGSHEADALIIEAMERSEKKRGNIPPETIVHCTTNSLFLLDVDRLLHESRLSSDQYPENSTDPENPLPGQKSVPIHSYFRNPEVMRSIREQQRIETRDFSEFTENDRQEAVSHIGPRWLHEIPDLSDEAFNRRHYRNEKNEARTRIREREKSQHDLYRLKRRVEKLETMDATSFRGHTLAEQQRDRSEALKCAGELVNRYDREEARSYDDDYSDQAEYYTPRKEGKKKANGINGSRKEKEKVKRELYYDHEEDLLEFDQPKPRKKKQKKAPAAQNYEHDGLVVDPNNALEYLYEDGLDYAPKKKNRKTKSVGSVLGKRKRTSELGMDGVDEGDYMEYEPLLPVNPTKSSHKKSAFAKPHVIPVPIKSEKNSKLLDAARKYNPNRTARDLNPFGAQMRTNNAPILSSEFTNFDIPLWMASPGPISKLELESDDPPIATQHDEDYPEDAQVEEEDQLDDDQEQWEGEHHDQFEGEHQPPPESYSNYEEEHHEDDIVKQESRKEPVDQHELSFGSSPLSTYDDNDDNNDEEQDEEGPKREELEKEEEDQ